MLRFHLRLNAMITHFLIYKIMLRSMIMTVEALSCTDAQSNILDKTNDIRPVV